MQIWLTSDNHFWHENIYAFTYKDKFGIERRVREQFKDAAEGDAFMLQAWRDQIKPEDHLWHLGDVTMFRGNHMVHAFVGLMKSLPGHKRLVLGNHDHYAMKVYTEAGFQKIRGSHKIDNLLLTHYPVHAGSLPRGAIADVHGHIHQNDSPPGPYVNISVEKTGYKPIALEEVKLLAEKVKVIREL